jgi:hypothetical protein
MNITATLSMHDQLPILLAFESSERRFPVQACLTRKSPNLFHRENGANSTKATESDKNIILAGKRTSIPAFALATIPIVNSTTATNALHPLSCRGSTVGDSLGKSGTSGPSPTNPTGTATIR